jgi:general secretion pathway protein G
MNKSGSAFRFGARGAFTLIELLLVMVILAILAAVVIPRFTNRTQQAQTTRARADITNMELALDAFEIDIGRFPTSSEGLNALVNQPSEAKNWRGPYIKRDVPDDPWGNPYVYDCPGKHNTADYDLYSFGPDGKSGGDDDIDNWSKQ